MSPDSSPPGDVTLLLERASGGNREAFDLLFPLVYDELKGLAEAKLRLERSDHTLNATGLVHEAYLKLVDQNRVAWQNRAHFFAIAARAMRRILINHAKGRKRIKRGGGAPHVDLESADTVSNAYFTESEAIELLALDEALERLHAFNPDGAQVVEYRFFGGLSHEEIGEVMGTAEVTVRRRWTAAKTWLRTQLAPERLDRAVTLLTGAEA